MSQINFQYITLNSILKCILAKNKKLVQRLEIFKIISKVLVEIIYVSDKDIFHKQLSTEN